MESGKRQKRLTQSRKEMILRPISPQETAFLGVLGVLSEAGVRQKGFHAKPQRDCFETKMQSFLFPWG
jgi:hypothetical protein